MKYSALLFSFALLFGFGFDDRVRAGDDVELLRTLYVAPGGDDAADGLAPETALASISAAADIVEPGDLVLVAGGVYLESVTLDRPGSAAHPIVFRAAPGETAVVTRGIEPDGWRKTPDTRSTWQTPVERGPARVFDRRTLKPYVMALDPDMVDEMPGAYYYDGAAGVLYVNAYGRRDPLEARVIAVQPWQGLTAGFFMNASHNRVEDFLIEFQPTGILVRGGVENSRATGNTLFGHSSGILLSETRGFTAARNEIFLNFETGITVRQGVEDSVIEENDIHSNGPRGVTGTGGYNINTYTTPQTLELRNNLIMAGAGAYRSDGRLLQDKRVRQRFVLAGNVFVGGHAEPAMNLPRVVTHNTVLRGELRERESHHPVTPDRAIEGNVVAGNLVLEEDAEIRSAGFADPRRNDYRLRADSPHLGAGAHPEAADVRYVGPDGDDEADGLTPDRAWRTLRHAAAEMRAGRTVYVLPGVYEESIRLAHVRSTEATPAAFKTYGRGQVVIDGGGRDAPGLVVSGIENLVVDGFIFRNFSGHAVDIEDSASVRLAYNVIDQSGTGVLAQNVAGLALINNTFNRVDTVLDAAACAGAVLCNNLLAQTGGAPLALGDSTRDGLVSEANVLSGPGADERLAAWRAMVTDVHPASAHEDLALEGPDYLLPVGHVLGVSGLGHRPIGARPSRADESEIVIENFRVASASPDRAVLRWATPYDYAAAVLAWARADGGGAQSRVMGQSHQLRLSRQATQLTGLEPGTAYRVQLEVTNGQRSTQRELIFTTPAENPAPATRCVSPDGSDENDGSSWARAYRSLSAASEAANPGDTILVAPGVYHETLTVLQDGLSEDRHLVFRSVEPGAAILDLAELYPIAIQGSSPRHLTIDGFTIRGLQYGSGFTAVRLHGAYDLRLVNNVFEPHAGLRSRNPVSMTCTLLSLNNAERVLIEDNLFHFSFRVINIWQDGGKDIVINHNTFYRAGLWALVANVQDEDAAWTITNNIAVRAGRHPDFRLNSTTRNLVMTHNLHWPDPEDGGSPMLQFYRDGRMPGARTVEQMLEIYGTGEGTIIDDPLFTDPSGGDFTLRPDSPARGAAADGSDLGMRNPPAGRP